MKYKFLVCLLLTLILAGCATANGPIFSQVIVPQSDSSIVYVYRGDFGRNQSAYTPDIFIDDVKVVELKRNAYSYFHVLPGRHTIELKHNAISGYPDLKYEFVIVLGERKYIEIFDPVNVSGGGAGLVATYSSVIREIEETKAISELKTKRFDTPVVNDLRM